MRFIILVYFIEHLKYNYYHRNQCIKNIYIKFQKIISLSDKIKNGIFQTKLKYDRIN